MYIIAMAKVFHEEIPWKKNPKHKPIACLNHDRRVQATYLLTYSMEQSPS